MPVSRRLVLILSAALPAALACRAALAAPDTGATVAVIQQFYADLLAVMKEAKRLSFDQRYQRLAPAVTRTFDLALMTRLSIGPGWTSLTADQQRQLADILSRYTISVYAGRFDDFKGERFEVDPAPTTNANGVVVQSRLIEADGNKVTLNYLMRPSPAGAWQAIDVYLSGTISELATRRSEYISVLQSSGADGLLRLLQQRTAALRTG